MTLSAFPTRFTPDDLLELDNDSLFELVDGKLVEKQMSSIAGKTTILVSTALQNFLTDSNAGDLYSETTFRCFPQDPDLVRRPDIAFVATDRLAGVSPEGHVTIAPDLAIEVISPNDKIYDMDRKLADYRSVVAKL